MDFSRDLEFKRTFTLTPFELSKELYSPLLPFKQITRSSQSLPSLQEIGIRQLMISDKRLPNHRFINDLKTKPKGLDSGYDQGFTNTYIPSQKKSILTQVLRHTFFPSTEVRIRLAQQLNMTPRSVQIWFQNKRQSRRSKKGNQSMVDKRN